MIPSDCQNGLLGVHINRFVNILSLNRKILIKLPTYTGIDCSDLYTSRMKPKSAGKKLFPVLILSLLINAISRLKGLNSHIIELGDILKYNKWMQSNFQITHRRARRESVWRDVHKSLNCDPYMVYEFGVAWGYIPWWWFKNYEKSIISWHGFDSFEGLPRAWRGLPQGAFETGGTPPQVGDERVTWHVGLIEKTIHECDIPRDREAACIFLFDLDLLEASTNAWNRIKNSLKVGDILYFDEDEQILIKNSVLSFGQFEFVSMSWTALALKIIEINREFSKA